MSEFQRRLWLGAEAAELDGRVVVAVVAEATGVAADTVALRGRHAQVPMIWEFGPGVRFGPVAGARRQVASEPNPMTRSWWRAFESLIDPVTRADPMSPLRWTSKSIRALTAALRENGHLVSDFVVRRLLREFGYSLQANVKTAEGAQHADRDAQFAYLNDQATAHLACGDPVISVDIQEEGAGRGL